MWKGRWALQKLRLQVVLQVMRHEFLFRAAGELEFRFDLDIDLDRIEVAVAAEDDLKRVLRRLRRL